MEEPERSTDGGRRTLRGWRRTVALTLIYWYLIAILAGIGAFVLIWVYAFTVSPAEEYWACMDRQIPSWKQVDQNPAEVFLASDAMCHRPADLSEQSARAEWVQHWNAPPR